MAKMADLKDSIISPCSLDLSTKRLDFRTIITSALKAGSFVFYHSMHAPLYAFYQGHILMFFANNSVIKRFRVKKVATFLFVSVARVVWYYFGSSSMSR
jgi:hypothetical protein